MSFLRASDCLVIGSAALLSVGNTAFGSDAMATVGQWAERLIFEILDAFAAGMTVVEIAFALDLDAALVAAAIVSAI